MNKLNKVFVAIILILTIALIIVTVELVKMTTIAKDNLNLYLQSQDELHNLIVEKELQNTVVE